MNGHWVDLAIGAALAALLFGRAREVTSTAANWLPRAVHSTLVALARRRAAHLVESR